MKKLLIVLAALLLAVTPALAEGATQTVPVADGAYIVNVPADYVVLSADTVEAVFANETIRANFFEPMGLTTVELAREFMTMSGAGSVMIFDASLRGRVDIRQEEWHTPMEAYVEHKDAYDKQFMDEFVSGGIPAEAVNMMGIREFGGLQWYGYRMQMGAFSQTVLFTVVGEVRHVFSFSNFDEQAMLDFMSTFAPAAQ